MIDVVTVWAPRKSDEHWRDTYLDLLAMQAKTVHRARHRHIVVTDTELRGYLTLRAQMQESLMFAILEGQLAYVKQWSGDHPFVMLDIDCLVARKLDPIFNGSFEIMLTNRSSAVSPIQNGAMYFDAGCKQAAIDFFERSLELCLPHWGGDQEAISKAVAPVPQGHVGTERRFGVRVKFAPTDLFNHSSKEVPRLKNRFVFHFKGNTKNFAHVVFENIMREPLQ